MQAQKMRRSRQSPGRRHDFKQSADGVMGNLRLLRKRIPTIHAATA